MKSKSSQSLISQVLSPALKLWLATQVEEIAKLQINISGSNRQIIGGYIPRVSLKCDRAIYQGLHLSQAELQGENIRINIGQVIKGKPLQLLEPIVVTGKVLLEEKDLQASLSANLLSAALANLLPLFIAASQEQSSKKLWKDKRLNWQEIKIDAGKLTLRGTCQDAEAKEMPISLCTGLDLTSPHELSLSPISIETPELDCISINNYKVDLGEQVHLEELKVTPGQVFCRGSLTVISD
ncbi:MAG: DUF2993 domain-containing protein [Spirulinaceae cyanobacterium]